MFAITPTPVRVYNSVDDKSSPRHWRQNARARRQRAHIFTSHAKPEDDTLQIKELQEKIEKYEEENKKLKLLASWNLRAVQSALKNCEEMSGILEE